MRARHELILEIENHQPLSLLKTLKGGIFSRHKNLLKRFFCKVPDSLDDWHLSVVLDTFCARDPHWPKKETISSIVLTVQAMLLNASTANEIKMIYTMINHQFKLLCEPKKGYFNPWEEMQREQKDKLIWSIIGSVLYSIGTTDVRYDEGRQIRRIDLDAIIFNLSWALNIIKSSDFRYYNKQIQSKLKPLKFN